MATEEKKFLDKDGLEYYTHKIKAPATADSLGMVKIGDGLNVAPTGELSTEMQAENYYTKEDLDDELTVNFPLYGAEGDDTLGDCSILKSKTKSMMIDCFSAASENTFTSIRAALSNLGIDKLDYLLITHYHADHFGNIFNLIDNGYLEGATVILPRTPSRWSGQYDGQSIKDALDAANIDWVECANQTIMLDDAQVDLFNGSAADYAYYDAYSGEIEVTYNDYSIYCNVTFKDKKMLFTGDGDIVSTAYVASRYLKSGYDLLKANHHGFTKFDPNYVKKVNPKYVVIPASVGMVNKNLSRWSVDSPYWNLSTSHIYFQGYQSEMIEFGVRRDGVLLKSQTYSIQQYSGSGNWNYYVDGTTTDLIRTGSAEHPFKTLAEAAAMTPKNTVYQITINIINLDADAYDVYFTGFENLEINFDNIQFDYSLRFYRCKCLTIKNLNTSKNVLVDNCQGIISGLTSTATSTAAVNILHSSIELVGALSISGYTGSAFELGRDSKVYFSISSLTTVIPSGKRIINGWGSLISFTTASIAVFKDYKFLEEVINLSSFKQCAFSENVKELMLLFESSTAAYSGITTKEAVSNYPLYKMLWKDVDGNTGIATAIPGARGNLVSVFRNSAGTEVWVKNVYVTDSATGLSLNRNGQAIIRTDGSTTIETTDKIGILKVWGAIE